MKTKIIKIHPKNMDKNDLEEAARIIRSSGIVAFPTETVYGLGANGLDPLAVGKIFQAKGRPADNPLILHVSSLEQVEMLAREIGDLARLCMEEFWPGPLTILFKRSSKVPDIVTAGLDTVALRMPDNQIALALIELAGLPVAAPSANLSGRPSPTSFHHVREDMMGKIDMIIDGGATGIGLESTVLDLSGEIPMILRPGGVTIEELRPLIPDIVFDPSITDMDGEIVPRSPGQKYRHYAPRAEMILFEGELEKLVAEINKRIAYYSRSGRRVGVMCTDETEDLYREALVISLGSREDERAIASNLFYSLRRFDEEGVDIILAESIEGSNLGSAIMNRLKKAASGNIVKL